MMTGTAAATTRRMAAVLAVAVMMLAAVPMAATAGAVPVPAAPDGGTDFNIVGAGASFPFPLIDLWRVEYEKEFDNVHLNYQSIGSGGGIKQHIEKTVNFAASDKPLGIEVEQAPGTLHIPETIGGVTVAYNLPEFPQSGLNMTGEVVAEIFMGGITMWNDPRLAEINPGASLPDEEIVTVHRSDGSGTTFVFTDYLSSVHPPFDLDVGKGKSVPWPVGLGGKGNEGVTANVRNTEYSVGYVELAYAFQSKMDFAHVQNADETAFVAPSIDALSAASAGAASALPAAHCDWSDVSIVNAPGTDSYPITSFTYLLVYEQLDKAVSSMDLAAAMVHMIHWMITDGQAHAPGLLYVPIPDDVADIGMQGLSRITYDGQKVFDYDGARDVSCDVTGGMSDSDVSSEDPARQPDGKGPAGYEIPKWIRDNARMWADGKISDEEYVDGLQYLISQGILVV